MVGNLMLRREGLRMAQCGRGDCEYLSLGTALEGQSVDVRDELRANQADFDFFVH